ncbi:MAG: InlB B-repeat-containing protein [bacterium JZ-2024 1]
MFKGRMTRRAIITFFACVLTILNLSCGGGGGGPDDTTPPDTPGLTPDSGIQPNATIAGSVTLKATASDNSGTVARIEFLVASTPLLACADNSPKPSGSVFQCVWNSADVANGTHELTIRAFDRANNSALSSPVPFTVQNPVLTVTKSGNGQGIVSTSDGKISCGSGCTSGSATYPPSTQVSLIATALPGSRFAGWSGDCSGTNSQVFLAMNAHKTCTATFALNPVLTVTKSGNGTVISDTGGINCGSVCQASFLPNTQVTLTAQPGIDSRFVGWSGDCSGTSPSFIVTMDADKSCTATFMLIPRTLTVAVEGSGTVTLTPPGTVCATSCSETYDSGQTVTLNAQPAQGFVFLNWTGDCRGTNATVQISMNADMTCTAHFAQTFALTVTKSGNGSGTVTSNPPGISCGTDCDESFVSGESIVLTAQDDPGSRFAGWSGDCTGSSSQVVVVINANKTCVAMFVRTQTLTVNKSGSGTVESSPAGINCGSICTFDFDEGTVVTLRARPDLGATFLGWSGAGCSGTDDCVVTMDSVKSVTASFSRVQRTLTVSSTGSGTGVVTSNPPGINCGTVCTAPFDDGSQVSLTATPDSGSVFSSWSGDCTGTSATVNVTMNGDKTCVATFVRRHTLTVTKSGNGGGTVISSPAGINCGPTCSATYDQGTVVTLSATPDSTSTFSGWSGGGCTGTGSCQVTMNSSLSVTATFTKIQFQVTINKTGSGTGTVTSAPSGINCGTVCSANFDAGTSLTLTATPTGGSTFGGWSGPCSGTGTCQFTVNANTTVGAVFNAGQVTITVNKTGSGVVVSTSPTGIHCGRTCQMTVNSGTQVTLTAQPGPAGQSFLGWSGGGCSGTGNCTFTATSNVTIAAQFTNTISYASDIQPLWENSQSGSTPCVNCHGGSGGLFLTPPASASHAQLVNVTMNQFQCSSLKRVLPDDPQNSGLIKKLTGTSCGSQMPQGGPPFSQALIDKIIAWIMAGAPLN